MTVKGLDRQEIAYAKGGILTVPRYRSTVSATMKKLATPKNIQMQVRVPATMRKALRLRAADSGTTVSAVVRQMLGDYDKIRSHLNERIVQVADFDIALFDLIHALKQETMNDAEVAAQKAEKVLLKYHDYSTSFLQPKGAKVKS